MSNLIRSVSRSFNATSSIRSPNPPSSICPSCQTIIPLSRSYNTRKPKPTPSSPFTRKPRKSNSFSITHDLVNKYTSDNPLSPSPTTTGGRHTPSSETTVHVKALQRARKAHEKHLKAATQTTPDLLSEPFRDFISLLTTLDPLPSSIALEEAEQVINVYRDRICASGSPLFQLKREEELRSQMLKAVGQVLEIWESWLERAARENGSGMLEENVEEWMRVRRQRIYLVVSEIYRTLDAFKELRIMLEFAEEKGLLDREFFEELSDVSDAILRTLPSLQSPPSVITSLLFKSLLPFTRSPSKLRKKFSPSDKLDFLLKFYVRSSKQLEPEDLALTLEMVLEKLRDVESLRGDDRVCDTLMTLFGKLDLYSEVENVWELVKPSEGEVRFGEEGQMELADSEGKGDWEVASDAKSLSFSRSFTAYIGAYTSASDIGPAQRQWDNLISRGYRPTKLNWQGYTTLLARSGQWLDAARLIGTKRPQLESPTPATSTSSETTMTTPTSPSIPDSDPSPSSADDPQSSPTDATTTLTTTDNTYPSSNTTTLTNDHTNLNNPSPPSLLVPYFPPKAIADLFGLAITADDSLWPSAPSEDTLFQMKDELTNIFDGDQKIWLEVDRLMLVERDRRERLVREKAEKKESKRVAEALGKKGRKGRGGGFGSGSARKKPGDKI